MVTIDVNAVSGAATRAMQPLGVNQLEKLVETRLLVAEIDRWKFHDGLPPVADAPGSPRAPLLRIIEIWGQNGTRFYKFSNIFDVGKGALADSD